MTHKQFDYFVHTYILLNVLVCFIAENFDEPAGRVKIQTKFKKYSAILHMLASNKLCIIQLLYFIWRSYREGRAKQIEKLFETSLTLCSHRIAHEMKWLH